MKRLWAIASGMILGVSCASTGTLDPRLYSQARRQMPPPCAGCKTPVRVTFLGVAGFLIEQGPNAVLTGPLYSNPPLDKVLANEVLTAQTAIIDGQLPADWVKDVDGILVGHSHYDHLMDVPYVANTKAKAAKVYGSKTMTHLIAGMIDDKARLVSLTPKVDYRMCAGLTTCENDNHGQPGDWEYVVGNATSPQGLRIRALCSKHSPQFAGLEVLWQGCAHYDMPPPTRAKEWMLGDTLSYLIDFTEMGTPVFRLYYQDSSTDPTLGYADPSLINDRPVDVALLCAGAFNQVRNNPAGILDNTKAKYALMGHWDNFFKPLSRPLDSLPAHDFAALVRKLEAATGQQPADGKYWFPSPGTSFVFQP